MRRKIIANTFLTIGLILVFAAVMPAKLTFGTVKALVAAVQPIDPSQALTKTLNAGSKGIIVRYPEKWSAGQSSLSSWVILNVPAAQQNTVKSPRFEC
jgi:hypothetical protein